MASVVNLPVKNYIGYGVDEWVARILLDYGGSYLSNQAFEGLLQSIEQDQLFPNGPSIDEIRGVYAPFACVLAKRITHYFEHQTQKKPACFILGVSGSVSVGKTTAARVLKTLLNYFIGPTEVVATDHFLLPNDQLEKRGLMRRKGFPESYDQEAMQSFVASLNRGDSTLSTPLYDHVAYTRLKGRQKIFNRPQCLILEGVSALQRLEWTLNASIFFQADELDLWRWYRERFLEFRRRAHDRPDAFFHRYSRMTEHEALAVARDFWDNVNWVNMKNHIEPSRLCADWIIEKGPDHRIRSIIEADSV